MHATGILCLVAVVLAGCGGAHSRIPPAPVGLGVPYGYRATHVWQADLSGQSVPDVIVASAGPPVTSFGFHSADIRVLVWDPLAHEWSVAFDAQKVLPPPESGDPGSSNSSPGLGFEGPSTIPLLDPKADVGLGTVRFVRFLSGRRSQLVFDASMSYGGSGVPSILAMVDFQGGIASLVYSWTGEELLGWNVENRVLRARAMYWTPTDAHCCALGRYSFAVAEGKYGVDEIRDSRPWLGVVVHALSDNSGLAGRLRITGFASLDDKAPAAGHLHTGDVILDVLNAPKPPKGTPRAEYSIFDKVILMRPGETARLLIDRDGRQIVVGVRLGSMRQSLGTFRPKTDYTYAAL